MATLMMAQELLTDHDEQHGEYPYVDRRHYSYGFCPLPPPPHPPNPWLQALPALMSAAVLGIGGLFLQVAKLDQNVSTIARDIQTLKTDANTKLTDLEVRVRELESHHGRD